MITLEKNLAELEDLNSLFQQYALQQKYIYNQLKNFGIQIDQSVLVDLYPDGENTVCGVIINQDSEVFEFDIDADHAEYSIIENITNEFIAKVHSGGNRLMSREKIAFNMHLLKINGY